MSKPPDVIEPAGEALMPRERPAGSMPLRHRPGWVIALAAFSGQTCAAFGFLSIPLLAPSLAAETGLNARDFSFSATFVFLAVGLASPACGPLIRRFGSAPLMTMMLLGMAASTLLILVGTWAATMAAGFLFGLCYGPYGPASSSVVATRTPAARRGFYMAVRQSGVPFAGALAGRIVPPVILAFGWWAGVFTVSGAILIGALLTVCAASLFTVPVEETEAAPRRTDGAGIVTRFFDNYRLPMPLQIVAITAVGFAISHLALASFAYFYLLEELGYGELAAGVYLSNVLLAATLGRPLMGLLVDWSGSPTRVLAGIAVVGAASFVALLLMTPTTPFFVTVAVAIAAGLSANTWTPVFVTAISNGAPRGRVADYNGRAFSYAALGWTLAAPVVWGLIELGGYALPFTLLIAVEIAMAITLLVLAPRFDRPKTQSS